MAWLHTTPEVELNEWEKQVSQAKWIEDRYYKTLARITHGNKAVK